jgi:CheY-like chemotaxis protein
MKGLARMEPPTVIVIDDVEAIVEELLTLLQLHAIPAVGAANLPGAIEALERDPSIRVISCDVRLDRESGIDIIRQIKAHPSLSERHYRYLFVTGDEMQLDRLESCSGLEVLSKPVQPAVLMATVKQLLSAVDG